MHGHADNGPVENGLTMKPEREKHQFEKLNENNVEKNALDPKFMEKIRETS